MLPELPRRRDEPEAAPGRRPGHGTVAQVALQLGRAARPARARDPSGSLCREASAPSCASRGRVAKYASDSSSETWLDPPLDPHLAAERRPVEQERRLRVRLQLAPLPRRVVREEDEPALVEALQQHHPHRRRTARIRRRERHRLRHLERRARLGEPAPELLERVGGEIRCAGARASPSTLRASPAARPGAGSWRRARRRSARARSRRAARPPPRR